MKNDLAHPFDVCLLLRAHGEQWWLTTEVLPVLEQLETPCAVPEDQVGAAFAYLEVLSIDASRRARETDAAFAQLAGDAAEAASSLHAEAGRYHAAVRALRASLGVRVVRLTRAFAASASGASAPSPTGPVVHSQAATL